MSLKITKLDPNLKPFEGDIEMRMRNYKDKKASLVGAEGSLANFANGHLYYGFHQENGGWV